MSYRIELHRAAKKDMKKLHPQIKQRVAQELLELAENPRMNGVIHMVAYDLY